VLRRETLLILIWIAAPNRRRRQLGRIWRRLTAGAVVRLKYGTAWRAELRRVRLQTGHNPVLVGYRSSAQAEYIRRASHLLFHGSAMLLGQGRRAANGGYRQTNKSKRPENLVLSHDSPFLFSK